MHKHTRRQFLKAAGFAVGSAGIIGTSLYAGQRQGGQERPNILWITSEDNSPLLGCYGDEQAHTPNLDRLATQGVRYRNAFANPPVCSAARSTLITGMYACSVGLHNHRSKVRIRTVIWGLGLQFVFAVIILREDFWSYVGMVVLGTLVAVYLLRSRDGDGSPAATRTPASRKKPRMKSA